MHSFFKKFFKVVGVGLISVFTLFFVGSAKSYALLDADKIVEVLFSAINSDGGVYVDLECEAGLSKSIFVVLKFDEKQFLAPICEVYRNFFEQPIKSPLLRSKKNLEYFKYAVLVRLFEKAIERLRFEQINVKRYKHRWWYRSIFSCTDEEAHTVGMLYQDFVQWGLFKPLELL